MVILICGQPLTSQLPVMCTFCAMFTLCRSALNCFKCYLSVKYEHPCVHSNGGPYESRRDSLAWMSLMWVRYDKQVRQARQRGLGVTSVLDWVRPDKQVKQGPWSVCCHVKCTVNITGYGDHFGKEHRAEYGLMIVYFL